MTPTNATPTIEAPSKRTPRLRTYDAKHFDRWAFWLGLCAFVAVAFRCFCIAHWQIQCPSHWPVSIGVLVFSVATLWLVTSVIQAMHARNDRLLAWGRLLMLLAPLLLATWGTVHVSRITSVRYIPDGLPLRLIGPFVVSLFDIESQWRFPNVYRGSRISMLTEQPMEGGTKLVQEADAFLLELEQKLGRKGNAQGRWVRGKLFGRNNFQVLGWIMSDYYATETLKEELTELDKHEIAHFAVHQFLGTQRMPPTFLIEGWAQYCSIAKETIASQAHDARFLASQVWSIGSLSSKPWRFLDKGPVYSAGGAWVAYLCETKGIEAFGDLFFRSGDEDFDTLVSALLEKDISDVEIDVWNWVEQSRRPVQLSSTDTFSQSPVLTTEEGSAWKEALSTISPTFQKLASQVGGLYWKETVVTSESTPNDPTQDIIREYWIFPTEKWMLGKIVFRDKPVLMALLENGETLALEKTSRGWISIEDMKGITDIRDYTSQFFLQAEESISLSSIDDYLNTGTRMDWVVQSKTSDDRGLWQLKMQSEKPLRQEAEIFLDPSLRFSVRELHLKTIAEAEARSVNGIFDFWIEYENDELLGPRVRKKKMHREWGVPSNSDETVSSFEWKTGGDVQLPTEFRDLKRMSVPYAPPATTTIETIIGLATLSSLVAACFCIGRHTITRSRSR